MNFDGSVNVGDIISIVNILLADGVGKGESINDGTVIVNSENIIIYIVHRNFYDKIFSMYNINDFFKYNCITRRRRRK